MNRRKRNRNRFRLIVFLLLFTGALVLLRFRYMPFLREAARTRVINVASDRINDAIYAQIASGSIDYSRVVCLEKEYERGDHGAAHEYGGDQSAEGGDTCAAFGAVDGNGHGGAENSDWEHSHAGISRRKGPGLPIRVVALSTTDADFYSEFTSAGINQTHQRILLEIKICMSVLTPAGTESVDVASVIVVAETVIVGSVPDSYFQLGQLPSSEEKG